MQWSSYLRHGGHQYDPAMPVFEIFIQQIYDLFLLLIGYLYRSSIFQKPDAREVKNRNMLGQQYGKHYKEVHVGCENLKVSMNERATGVLRWVGSGLVSLID